MESLTLTTMTSEGDVKPMEHKCLLLEIANRERKHPSGTVFLTIEGDDAGESWLTVFQEYTVPVKFCPFCGVRL